MSSFYVGSALAQEGQYFLPITEDNLEAGTYDSTVLALGPPLTLTRWKVHGVIAGTVRLDDGSILPVQGVRGAAEYVEIVW